jgi:hypothetical protein
MKRSYFNTQARFLVTSDVLTIVGTLVDQHQFTLELGQRDAWMYQVRHLQEIALSIPDAHIFMEFMIPRMGRRADVVLLYKGIVFVIEYKVGERSFPTRHIEQTLGYALDLKNFHETSHTRTIVPILVATRAPVVQANPNFSEDGLSTPLFTNGAGLLEVILTVSERFASTPIDPDTWASGRYRPTPTIIEAAQALYGGHNVEDISRSEAGAENLTETAEYISRVIEHSKAQQRKSICLVTGVPGSGKTLAGLSIANSRMNAHEDEHAVFLSGNGPLVSVLKESLIRDALEQARKQGTRHPSRPDEEQRVRFIQNVHVFRDDNLSRVAPPVEKVVVFDEAQRAWNLEQTRNFMRRKRKLIDFSESEPEFLLSVMDRHQDWCTVICLVGGGQEINTGEAGIREWIAALSSRFVAWDVYVSDQILGSRYLAESEDQALLGNLNATKTSSLHLGVSIRSFRAEHLSNFVEAIIDGDPQRAGEISIALKHYPIFVTRDLARARSWLRSRRRGPERSGLLASANAQRLKPEGIFVNAEIEPHRWFLASSEDIRSSNALEDVATEFDVQGLELDWTCVCWDANFRRGPDNWETFKFRGTKWQNISNPTEQAYVANAYRVLLTRARQGMVVFVPQGSQSDHTRVPSFYDGTFEYLRSAGMKELPDDSECG